MIYPIWQKLLYQVPASEYISSSMVNLSMSVSCIRNSQAIRTAELIGTYSLNNIYPDDREMVREEAIKCLKARVLSLMNTGSVKMNHKVMWGLESPPSFIKMIEQLSAVLWILQSANGWKQRFAK